MNQFIQKQEVLKNEEQEPKQKIWIEDQKSCKRSIVLYPLPEVNIFDFLALIKLQEDSFGKFL